MEEGNTTAIVQRYLNELANGDRCDETVRKLLTRAVLRLQMLCGSMLSKYGRLTQGPLNLCTEELLSAVVERLLKALPKVHPATPRQFFALANEHIRWALNDMARRLDRQEAVAPLSDVLEPASGSDSAISPQLRRILQAVEELPREEAEVFDMIHLQGLSQSEAAELLEVAPKTVQRRLNRALLLLSQRLSDLAPP